MSAGSFHASAQSSRNKKVTPVDIDDNKPPQPTLHYYDKHGNQLQEPVMFLATLDTVSKAKAGPKYPLYNGVSIGVNFFDAIMRLAGQRHYNFDISADVSLWNWIFPTVEAGLGFADNTPDNKNFTYKADPSPYFKVGFNYNFLYKSDPAYQAFLGFRAGYSSFKYSLRNVSIESDYWSQDSHFDMPDQKAHAWYGELLGGIKVKIVSRFSLGWTVRYKLKFNTPEGQLSRPWFVPGYGTNSPLRMTFSAIFNI